MNKENIATVILAGGQSRRMGRPKALLSFQGKPLIEYLIESLKTENPDGEVWIAGCPTPDLYQNLSVSIIEDEVSDRGPLEGMLSAMRFFQNEGIEAVLFVPCDGFNLPKNYIQQMTSQSQNNDLVCDLVYAKDSQREQQLYCLIKCSLSNDLSVYLEQGGRKVLEWFSRHTCEVVDFSENDFTFANLNTPDDWEKFNEKTI